MQRADWKDVSTALSLGSIIAASIGATLPDLYGRVVLAASVGLANAAVLCQKHGEPKQ